MKEIGDGVFSEKMVGDGLAIIPENETVCAPVSGKITVLMEDSKHAVGMTLSNGAEILIHVGIDTVSMGGDGFEYFVKVGDVVKVGTPLCKDLSSFFEDTGKEPQKTALGSATLLFADCLPQWNGSPRVLTICYRESLSCHMEWSQMTEPTFAPKFLSGILKFLT